MGTSQEINIVVQIQRCKFQMRFLLIASQIYTGRCYIYNTMFELRREDQISTFVRPEEY